MKRTASTSCGVPVVDSEAAVRNVSDGNTTQETGVWRIHHVVPIAVLGEASGRVGDVWCEGRNCTVTCTGARQISHLDTKVVIAVERTVITEGRYLAKDRGWKSGCDQGASSGDGGCHLAVFTFLLVLDRC
jgi:hypothetical protein